MNTPQSAADFTLEPSTGDRDTSIPETVIEELRYARALAKDYAQAYSDAIAAQAAKYKLKTGALKRYVNAAEADRLQDLDDEASDISKLLGK